MAIRIRTRTHLVLIQGIIVCAFTLYRGLK